MPWNQTCPMSERAKFALAAEEGLFSMTELCRRFGISRKTGYKWLGRYREGGLEALEDRSRAPKTIPHQTPEPVEKALVALRQKHPRGAPASSSSCSDGALRSLQPATACRRPRP